MTVPEVRVIYQEVGHIPDTANDGHILYQDFDDLAVCEKEMQRHADVINLLGRR
jgi:hypothetical protein